VYNSTSYSGGRSYGRGGGFGRRPSFGPKPVEVGKEYDVEITEISRRGDGIARVQGFVIFVAGGKTGQKAKIKVTSVAPRFASAELVSSGSSEAAQEAPTEKAE
jgi:predicted RNA-binding protein with TRAM domain